MSETPGTSNHEWGMQWNLTERDLSMWYAAHKASHHERYVGECLFCHDPYGIASEWLRKRAALVGDPPNE